MNISVCKIDTIKWCEIKENIKKYESKIMVLTIDFSQNKKQIEHLLFFDKLAKYIKNFLIIFWRIL